MVRRVTTTIADSSPPMTRDEAHAELRRLGELGDPDHEEYEQVRERVIEAFTHDAYPRVDRERASQIFDVFRQRPQLLPGPPPS